MTSIRPPNTTQTPRRSRSAGAAPTATLTRSIIRPHTRRARALARPGIRCRAPNCGPADVLGTGAHVANFERRSLTLEKEAKRQTTGTRFGDLGDRLTRAFTGGERKDEAWQEPGGPEEYSLRDESQTEWEQVVPRFPVVRQGYDTTAVDAHIADLEQELSELDRELSELRAHAPAENQVEEEIQRIGEQPSATLLP